MIAYCMWATSDALCFALCGKHIPTWVNRLANIGNAMGGGMMGSDATAEQKRQQLAKTNAEYAASVYTGPPKPIDEYVPEITTNFLLDQIDVDKCSGLNIRDGHGGDAMTPLFTQDIGNTNKRPIAVANDEEDDIQMLLFIPFKKPVTIESIGWAFPYSTPKKLYGSKIMSENFKIFVNKPNMDFDDAADTASAETITISQPPTQSNPNSRYWTQSSPLKITKFRNVSYLTVENKYKFFQKKSLTYIACC
ncbi:hypothetical protein RFI_13788 [Reticulomyxa filosa]|uniref:PITH domain-containing protein n=1 Tax=Reticulomyxa filosa TaxID=46433 RepID=X6NDJ4_RETFI|nr:hypothetical protein RFI_13788 [Reticulomyxa filosa]|eukprot:ETO23392.1 hypothetical protein RFI_13788 [Reticulomyxa filosa]